MSLLSKLECFRDLSCCRVGSSLDKADRDKDVGGSHLGNGGLVRDLWDSSLDEGGLDRDIWGSPLENVGLDKDLCLVCGVLDGVPGSDTIAEPWLLTVLETTVF